MEHSFELSPLLTRRSVAAKDLHEPGPSDEELDIILRAAIRVPDHKKLGPWRFIILSGEARHKFSEQVAQILAAKQTETLDAVLAVERERFSRAPLVIVAVFSPVENPKAPEWEQVLSTGAACQNILLAAKALDYGAQWLTEWCAYDADVMHHLGLRRTERIAGFIHIGSYKVAPQDRARPEVSSRVSFWQSA